MPRERDILKKHWPSFPHRKAKIPIYAKQCGSMEGRGDGAFVRGSRSGYYDFYYRKASKRNSKKMSNYKK